MTLLEVVVALSIGGMAVGAAVAAFQTVLRAHDDNSRFAGEMVRCASLRMSLTAWIREAVLKGGEIDLFRGLAQEGRSGASDELTLLTTADTPLGTGEVELHLLLAPRDAHSTAGLAVEFRIPATGRVERMMLDTTVRSLRIAYLPSRDSANRWMPGWISGSTLPRAVRITLETDRFDDSGALMHLPITIPLDRSP
jgi:hypothetical protein